MKVSVSEAKNRFSETLEHVAIGDEVIITDAGEPIAKHVRIKTTAKKRRKFKFGSAKGGFTVPDDFNDPLPKEIEDLFWK
ncbi:MAG: type II toxin-antitoxin system prevent-host-death family antitoxin [Terriglobales bacterium]